MKDKFKDYKPNRDLTPDGMYYSPMIKVDGLKNGERKPLKINKPVEVQINGGEWILIDPSDL